MDKDIKNLVNNKKFSGPIDELIAHVKLYSREIDGKELSTAEAKKIVIKLVQARA